MSVENALKFGELMRDDEKVMAKVQEIGLQNVDALIRYAAEVHGLVFDKDDLKKLGEEAMEKQELTEEQLEQLAGGVLSLTSAVAYGMALLGALVGAVVGAGVGAGAGVGVAAAVSKAF